MKKHSILLLADGKLDVEVIEKEVLKHLLCLFNPKEFITVTFLIDTHKGKTASNIKQLAKKYGWYIYGPQPSMHFFRRSAGQNYFIDKLINKCDSAIIFSKELDEQTLQIISDLSKLNKPFIVNRRES